MPATGAQPTGSTDEHSAALAVQEMFNSIAPRYDTLNHVLSCNVDRLWWWRTAHRFRTVLARPEALVVDVCCGTGDMAMALRKRRTAQKSVIGEAEIYTRPILAMDFAHQMLLRGSAKFSHPGVIAIEADAMRLPLRDGTASLITTAFGFRNLANYESGLREFHRALAPGGELGILDFSEPSGSLGKLYAFYFRRILPQIGKLLSGVTGPYAYLPSSVERFPTPPEMMAAMRRVGFMDVSWTPYTFGIAGLYRAVKR